MIRGSTSWTLTCGDYSCVVRILLLHAVQFFITQHQNLFHLEQVGQCSRVCLSDVEHCQNTFFSITALCIHYQ